MAYLPRKLPKDRARQHAKSGVLPGPALEPCQAVVTRPVVHRHDLELFEALALQRGEARLEGGRRIAHREQDGEARRERVRELSGKSWEVWAVRTAEEIVVDFGHLDFWFSDAAETEVWEPIADWIKQH